MGEGEEKRNIEQVLGIKEKTMARKKPCEFCEDDWWETQEDKGLQVHVEVYPFNNVIGVTAFANDEMGEVIERSISLPMNYCPNCGRKLD